MTGVHLIFHLLQHEEMVAQFAQLHEHTAKTLNASHAAFAIRNRISIVLPVAGEISPEYPPWIFLSCLSGRSFSTSILRRRSKNGLETFYNGAVATRVGAVRQGSLRNSESVFARRVVLRSENTSQKAQRLTFGSPGLGPSWLGAMIYQA